MKRGDNWCEFKSRPQPYISVKLKDKHWNGSEMAETDGKMTKVSD